MFDVMLNDTIFRLETLHKAVGHRLEKDPATAQDGLLNTKILDYLERVGNIAREYSDIVEPHLATDPLPAARAAAMRATIGAFKEAPRQMEKLISHLDRAVTSGKETGLSPLFARQVNSDYEEVKKIIGLLHTVWVEAEVHITARERAYKTPHLVKVPKND